MYLLAVQGFTLEDITFNIEDSSISGDSHILDIGHFSFLSASISESNITVFDIGTYSYSSISKINIVPDIEAQHDVNI
jgi:hypothetical protein